MDIIIENCSSPGASFTDNTNNVMIKCYEWITENREKVGSFSEFRRELTNYKGINADNARNIYPLLKKCGLIKYESRGSLIYNDFFTENGLAYVKMLLLIEKLIQANDDKSIKALKKALEIKEEIIYQGLLNLIFFSEANYKTELCAMIKFIICFGKINRNEFAYLLYELSDKKDLYSDSFVSNILDYRNRKIDITVRIRVRNDIEIREKTNEQTRLESLSYFTPYTYLSSLLLQAGILHKGENNYLYLDNSKKKKCEYLVEEKENG